MRIKILLRLSKANIIAAPCLMERTEYQTSIVKPFGKVKQTIVVNAIAKKIIIKYQFLLIKKKLYAIR